MSRRDRHAPRTRRPEQGGPRWWVAAPVLIAAIALAWLGFRSRGHDHQRPVEAAAGPASALAPEAAYRQALALSRSGRFDASVPYFERALTGTPPDPWVIHYDFAGVLYSTGLEEQGSYGFSRPALRSSIERVALMRRALAELDAAERLAPTARDRATVIHERGVRLQVWGFPWEAFVQLRQAQWTDPKASTLAGAADAYMRVLEHPEREARRGPTPARGPLTPPASPPSPPAAARR